MSIEDVNKIDSMAMPSDGADMVSLAISDHLSWGCPIEEHLYKLQQKINTYISFIGSGDIYESFLGFKSNSLKIIEIQFKCDPPEQALSFLKQVSDILKSINIDLKYKVLR